MAIPFNNRKKLLAFILSMTMALSTVAGLAACNDGNDTGNDDSGNTTTETDSSTIKNGSFEFFDDNDGKSLIVTSVSDWTKTNNSASTETTYSSKTVSGIVDTDKDVWDNLTKSNLDEDVVIETAEQAEAYWSQMSA